MLMPGGKKITIPRQEVMFMDPRIRSKFFMNILNEYKKRCPNFKLEYAFLNTDPKCPLDFVFLFSTKSTDGTTNLAIYDMTYLYADRSLPGYRYCLRMDKKQSINIDDPKSMTSKYFEQGINNMVTLEQYKFNEFINHYMELSIDPKNDKYWKKPKYAKDVAKNMMDMSLRYVKKH